MMTVRDESYYGALTDVGSAGDSGAVEYEVISIGVCNSLKVWKWSMWRSRAVSDLPVRVRSDGTMEWISSDGRNSGFPAMVCGDGAVCERDAVRGDWGAVCDVSEVRAVVYDGVDYSAPLWLVEAYSGGA